MFNEREKKDKLKKQFDQLIEVLIKITKSLEVIESVTSSVDEQVVRQAKHISSRGRTIGEWMDRLLSQGAHLLCSTITLISGLEEVKVEIENNLNLFSSKLEAHEKDFDSWLKLEDFQLDVLVDNGVIPSRGMHIEKREIIEYQMNTLEMLIKDLRKVQNKCNDKGKDIIEKT